MHDLDFVEHMGKQSAYTIEGGCDDDDVGSSRIENDHGSLRASTRS